MTESVWRRLYNATANLETAEAARKFYDGARGFVAETGTTLGDTYSDVSDDIAGVLGLLSLKNLFSDVTLELKSLNPMKHKFSRIADATARLTDRGIGLVSIIGLVAVTILGYTVKGKIIPVELLNGLWLGGAALALGRSSVATKRNLQARGALGVDEGMAIDSWSPPSSGKSPFWLKDGVGTSDMTKRDKIHGKAVRQTTKVWLQNLANTLSLVAAVAAFAAPGAGSFRTPLTVVRALVASYLVLQVVGWMKSDKPDDSHDTEMGPLSSSGDSTYGTSSSSSSSPGSGGSLPDFRP